MVGVHAGTEAASSGLPHRSPVGQVLAQWEWLAEFETPLVQGILQVEWQCGGLPEHRGIGAVPEGFAAFVWGWGLAVTDGWYLRRGDRTGD